MAQHVTCSVVGCGRPSKSWGLCNTHNERRRRTGAVQADVPVGKYEAAVPTATGHGYLRRYAPDHVLANGSGFVYEHRKVLFDLIGYGPHLCRWCDAPVNWSHCRVPAKDPTALTVDHLDSDGTNNDPDNLVPSCHPCNFGRAKAAEQRWARQTRIIA